MNQQVYNILKNIVNQHKQDQKAFLDQVELHMSQEIKDFTKLNDYMTSIVDNQNMIRLLLCRLWATP